MRKNSDKNIREKPLKKRSAGPENRLGFDGPGELKMNICTNASCRLRKAGCRGFEGCPGYKGK
jgi:hypothetical protein